MIFCNDAYCFLYHPAWTEHPNEFKILLQMAVEISYCELLSRVLYYTNARGYFDGYLHCSWFLCSCSHKQRYNFRFHCHRSHQFVKTDIFQDIVSQHNGASILAKGLAKWAIQINANWVLSIKSTSWYFAVLVLDRNVGRLHNAKRVLIERNGLFCGRNEIVLYVVVTQKSKGFSQLLVLLRNCNAYNLVLIHFELLESNFLYAGR